MMTSSTRYYAIRLDMLKPAPAKMFVQEDKGEMFLSAHGLLAGLNKMAHLESAELAEKFLEAYMPRLQARYGNDVRANVCVCEAINASKHIKARIQKDSAIARKRLETGILASNRNPFEG